MQPHPGRIYINFNTMGGIVELYALIGVIDSEISPRMGLRNVKRPLIGDVGKCVSGLWNFTGLRSDRRLYLEPNLIGGAVTSPFPAAGQVTAAHERKVRDCEG